MCRSEWKCQAFDIQRMREQRSMYYYIQTPTLGSSRDSRLWTLYTLSVPLYKTQPLSIGLTETQIWQLIFSGMNIPHSIFPRAIFHLHHFLLHVCTHIIHIPKCMSTLFLRRSLNLLWSICWKVCTQMLCKEAFKPIDGRRKKAQIWLLGYIF